MSVYHRSTAKSRILQEFHNHEEEIAAALSRQMSNKTGVESDKRMRREIANSNERRRMQSINAGFQLLRSLLPQNEGEKLSKAAILQQTTEFIHNLQQEKAKTLAQNAYFKRVLTEVSRRCNIDLEMDISLYGGSPPLKRKKRDTESSDEGITADFEDYKYEDIKREVIDLRQKLEQERQLRMILELRSRNLETHHLESHPYVEKVEPMEEIHNEEPVKTATPLEKQSLSEQKREDVNMLIPLQIDLDTDHRVPSSPQHRSDSLDTTGTMSTSMSRRNLETIVEAIRHLEGEADTRVPAPQQKHQTSHCTNSAVQRKTKKLDTLRAEFYVAHSEESEEHSCITSDQDDLRSDSSGRDSPSSQHHYVRLQSAQNLQPAHEHHDATIDLSTSKVVVPSSSYSEKYPAVTNVLQGNSPQLQMYCRPGVIVQKS